MDRDRKGHAMTGSKILLVAIAALATGAQPLGTETAGATSSDVLVSVGSPTTPFPQSWQTAPALAIDPAHPNVVAATAQDTLDAAACSAWDDPTFCPFGRVGFDGIYFSFDGGSSWAQPTYTGLTRRECLGPADCQLSVDDFSGGLEVGPIGTVPGHYQLGMFGIWHPVVAFGPIPGPDGTFSWDNGTRLYNAHELQEFDPNSPWFKPAFKGITAVGVSRLDGQPALTPEIVADQANWMPPVIVTQQSNDQLSSGAFGQGAVWADNAESSPHFGTVYACDTSSREGTSQIILDVSTDGGTSWDERHVSRATGRKGGRAFCLVRTDSEGTVHLFWNEGALEDREIVTMTRSFDGGRSFERPRTILDALDCGTHEELGMDGVTGATASPVASVDLANGAPSGGDATDQIVLTICDGTLGIDATRVLVITSNDGGATWSDPVDAAQPGDRPNGPAIAISPDGDDVYLVYQAYLDPWRDSLAGARRVEGVAIHANASDLSTWTTLHRGAVGDARASSGMSAGGRDASDLGFYQGAAATRDAGILLWTDIRNADRCRAIEEHRQGLVDDPDNPLPIPAPNTDCPPTFGNSDIYGAVVVDPTP
jgi:hypothetical protein